MYVCLCKGVSDKAIRQAVAQGARSWRDVREQTGCATQCGKCACMAKTIAHDAMAQEGLAKQEDMGQGAAARSVSMRQPAMQTDLAYAI